MTTIVNVFGGPSSGKSVLACELFVSFKKEHYNAELVMEYAKDLTWEGRQKALLNQVYVFGKQQHRIHRLINSVDLIITDSPMILSIFYGRVYGNYPESFYNSCLDTYNSYNNINIFLNRGKHYQIEGRNQTQEEAIQFDNKIKKWLEESSLPFIEVEQGDVKTSIQYIKERLKNGE